MNININEKLTLIKNYMKKKNIDICVLIHQDPHQNLYIPEFWNINKLLTNFKGNSQDIILTSKKNYILVDNIYFQTAKKTINTSQYILINKNNLSLTKIINTICDSNNIIKNLLINPKMMSINVGLNLQKIKNINLIYDHDNIIKQIRQYFNNSIHSKYKKIFIHNQCFHKYNSKIKIRQIKNMLVKKNIDNIVFNNLDDISWILNLKGSDIKFSPLIISYLIIRSNQSIWFVNNMNKLHKNIVDYLTYLNIKIKFYNDFYRYIEKMSGKTWLDPNKSNFLIYNKCKIKPFIQNPPILINKLCKNKDEIKNIQKAHIKDACAYINFMYWLENNWKHQNEISCKNKLLEFRLKQKNSLYESFNSISAFAENSAIIHYTPNKKSNKIIKNNNIYLLDTGHQYLEGTTDVTRVFHFGNPTIMHKKYYTTVLKSHIDLSSTIFPLNTKGSQLDTIARKNIWQIKNNYPHNTGHGISICGCVHEKTICLSPQEQNYILPGMIFSNEPGIYINNKFGIRIENIQIVKFIDTKKNFLKLKNLTLIPYEKKLINKNMLNDKEILFINKYHTYIYQKLKKYFNKNIQNFLKKKTEIL